MKKHTQTDDFIKWSCLYCMEQNETWVDLTFEAQLDIIEECFICSRPNRVIIKKLKDNKIHVQSKFIDEL
ncbi:MAG: CPXCG motif-containing cysteine-rich protein [Ignavibacteriales bacterium]|nr:CPXCG motif-containing cysteine-rich protein [Ignavibacteriaceae bacterium]NLH61341.1 CPXCG motif-containing cysteine-rich protein [Ignavibacteriales bacterium]HOJ18621.1 CPXCG motif-containing cysteine-rich protein [Ignavibacteriaceae bacterium]HPO56937.1 CPXCG motif-containing cysteine-rich protein [Ignavibacteriaceae bacterium]